MLSFVVRLATQFEQEHGYRPNRLYLSGCHYAQLRAELAGIRELAPLVRLLGMQIVLTQEGRHPRVACSDPALGWAAAV